MKVVFKDGSLYIILYHAYFSSFGVVISDKHTKVFINIFLYFFVKSIDVILDILFIIWMQCLKLRIL